MPIFQNSVIKKYLNSLNQKSIEEAYNRFKANYSNSKIEQIKELKEEEYQDGFLRDIFVDVLGYTLRPEENYNILREYKNQTDGKKADAAIIKENNAIAVIELKSTKTKDLTLVTQQAFTYKFNQSECKYVVTSNFQKLRFYVDYATEYEEFDLFHLDRQSFEIFYLILSKESIYAGLPLKIKEETRFREHSITAQLYKDYSLFKGKLFENLCSNNPKIDKLILFKKSQKLIDRFLFVLFAEDSGLLPPNSIPRMIKRFDILKEEDAYKPLYDIFKQFFSYLNIGRKGKRPEDDIPAYNGGLFKEDEMLNDLIIDDDVFIGNLMKLSEYDFNTEVDVNILGHIFEHSLSEIEEVSAEIQGTEIDRNKSKRKKDGVFYTPKYITQYIVENSIGKLCSDKRQELNILEIEFDGSYRTAKRTLNDKGKELFNRLNSYKEWLLSLKIVDPACGSGAFLNQALSFLIAEHQKIDDIIAELTDTPLRLFDVDKDILENNLFGVDINEESIEIAQLSLWLRTARKDRKLSTLSNNIKCGNSLIADSAIAGNKAFSWEKEFPDVFSQGGFDAVIGNPPYIKEATNKKAFIGLHNNKCYQGKMDLWYLFGSLALKIVKPETGLISYIAPNNWITNDGATRFRDIVLNEGKLIEFVDFGDFKVFDSAGIQTMIYVMKRSTDNKRYSINYSKVNEQKICHEVAKLFLEKKNDDKFVYYKSEINRDSFLGKTINFINSQSNVIVAKIEKKHNFHLFPKEVASGIDLLQDFVNKTHKEILNNVEVGDGIFNLSQFEYESLQLSKSEKEIVKPFFTTKELYRYFGNRNNKLWVIYTNSDFKDEKKIAPFPNIKAHLDKFIPILTSVNKPYGLHRARNEDYFIGEKIFSLRKCSARPAFTYCNFDAYVNRTFLIIKTSRIDLKYLTGLLNSNVIAYWLKLKGKMQGNNYQIDKKPLLNLPLVDPDISIKYKVSKLVDKIILTSQKTFDYNELLNKAKEENDFDREIKLSNEIEKFHKDINQYDLQINDVINSLYDLSYNEIKTINEVFRK